MHFQIKFEQYFYSCNMAKVEQCELVITPKPVPPNTVYIDVTDTHENKTRQLEFKRSNTIRELIRGCVETYPQYKGQFILRSGTATIGSEKVPLNATIASVWTDKVQIPSIDLLTSSNYGNINNINIAMVLLSFGNKIPLNLYGLCPFNNKRIGRGVFKVNQNDNNHYNNLVVITTPAGNYLVNTHVFYEKISGTNIEASHKFDVKFTFSDGKSFVMPKREHYKDVLGRYNYSLTSHPNPLDREFKLVTFDLVESETVSNKLNRVFGFGSYGNTPALTVIT